MQSLGEKLCGVDRYTLQVSAVHRCEQTDAMSRRKALRRQQIYVTGRLLRGQQVSTNLANFEVFFETVKVAKQSKKLTEYLGEKLGSVVIYTIHEFVVLRWDHVER
jgi:hypothetical protein